MSQDTTEDTAHVDPVTTVLVKNCCQPWLVRVTSVADRLSNLAKLGIPYGKQVLQIASNDGKVGIVGTHHELAHTLAAMIDALEVHHNANCPFRPTHCPH